MKDNIHNDYGLTQRQIDKFIEIFPHTREQYLSIRFGLNNNQISNLRKKYNLVKNRNVFVLTPSQIGDFKRVYYGYSINELCNKFKVTRGQIDYLVKKLELSKKQKQTR